MSTLVLATPTRSGDLDWRYVQSLFASLPMLKQAGYEPAWMPLPNLPTPQARNMAVAKAFGAGADKIVFLDDDVFWNPPDLVRLVQHPHPVVGGTYQKKQNGVAFASHVENGARTDAYGLLPASYLPAGFLKINMDVFETMVEVLGLENYPHPASPENEAKFLYPFFQQYFSSDTGYVSEDVWFCYRWQDCGGVNWLDPQAHIGHVGEHVYNADFRDQLRKEKVA